MKEIEIKKIILSLITQAINYTEEMCKDVLDEEDEMDSMSTFTNVLEECTSMSRSLQTKNKIPLSKYIQYVEKINQRLPIDEHELVIQITNLYYNQLNNQ